AGLVGGGGLGGPAGLAGGDLRLADRVEQRGLAVVDVAHDRDDRRARLELVLGVGVLGLGVDVVGGMDDLDVLVELVGEDLDGVVGQRLGERGHLAQRHQLLDDLGDGHAEVLGDVLDRRAGIDLDEVDGLLRVDVEGTELLLLVVGAAPAPATAPRRAALPPRRAAAGPAARAAGALAAALAALAAALAALGTALALPTRAALLAALALAAGLRRLAALTRGPALLRARLRADGLDPARLLWLGRLGLLPGAGAGAVAAHAQHLERQALVDRRSGRLDREPGFLQLLDDLL